MDLAPVLVGAVSMGFVMGRLTARRAGRWTSRDLLITVMVLVLLLDFVNNCYTQGMNVLAKQQYTSRRTPRGCGEADGRVDRAWLSLKKFTKKLVSGKNTVDPCHEHLRAHIEGETCHPFVVALFGLSWSTALGESAVGAALGWLPKVAEVTASAVTVLWQALPYTVKYALFPVVGVFLLLCAVARAVAKASVVARCFGASIELNGTQQQQQRAVKTEEQWPLALKE